MAIVNVGETLVTARRNPSRLHRNPRVATESNDGRERGNGGGGIMEKAAVVRTMEEVADGRILERERE